MGSHTQTFYHGRFAQNPYADDFFKRNGHTKTPQLVQWMVTLCCPLHCPHCLSAGDFPRAELSLAEAERLIEQVAALDVPELLITGGEPMARPDLPEIIRMLGAYGVRWSLNTACMPGVAARRAMEVWPPGFVAVSLDGPRRVHDRFRGRRGAFHESMRAIAYYGEITGGNVAAGTTVTTKNYGHLAETFSVVLSSGASQWGLHLLVPEGRAAQHKDLFLSRSKLKGLLSFAASKRVYFNVTIADEIGYCGGWEPLVRDVPFFCGAGQAQCVVLPDGEVVPCTTLDTSFSAGNVRDRSLAEIWADGFVELRQWSAPAGCAACEYVSACRGGCWLQRKNGTQCFKGVWHMPGLMRTALGVAICLGLGPLAAIPEAPRLLADTDALVQQEAPEVVQEQEQQRDAKEAHPPEAAAEKGDAVQQVIAQWYSAQTGGSDAPSEEDVRRLVQEGLGDDPAGKYILDFMDGKRPDGLQDRVKDIRRCLTTKHHSLALTGLLWRDVAEWCLDGTHPSKRSGEECEMLRTTVALLARTTRSWRVEALQDKIAAFLDRENAPKIFPQSKAMLNKKLWRARQAARSHWRNVLAEMSKSSEMMRVLEEYLDAYQSAAEMEIGFTAPKNSGLVILTGEERSKVKDEDALGLFDIIIVPGDAALVVAIPLGGAAEADLKVKLPKGTELAYADVLRLAYEQNGEYLDSLIKSDKVRQAADFPWPLLLPALRAEEQLLLKEMEKGETASKAKGDEDARQRLEEKRRRLRDTRERLARIWLY